MKRLLSICLLVLCLCVPVFAGHTLGGGWCECGSFAGCGCDPGEKPGGQMSREPDKAKQDAPIDFGSETLLVLAALILVLRYKA